MMQPLEADDPRSAGEFRLRARLGAGGMGRVFLGYSPGGRAVAVKICHPEFAADPAFVRRFALEVAAARAVNGLYTAQVIDAGPDDSPPWLATSYVPGPSLYDAVNAAGPLTEPAVWRLAAGLAEALQAVHVRGLVHRDLKPTNVLLAADGPRVIDFGVARALDGTSLTTTGIAFGTPSYMSPEQASGEPATAASDVFALGCVLCFAATAGVPFGDGDAPSVLYRVVHAPPALDAVPPGLRELLAACLAKNPAGRPTLAQILYACQGHAPRPGETGYGSSAAASFWPAQVGALIASYQASLRDAGAALQPPGERTQATPPAYRPPTMPPAYRPPTMAPPARSPTMPPPARSQATLPPGQRPVGRRRILGLAGGGLAAAGLAAGGWELSRSGPGQPRRAVSAAAGASDRQAWTYPTGGQVTSGAAAAGGVVYIGSGDQYVYAFEATGGRLLRRFGLGAAVSAAVTAAGSSLLAAGADGTVHALPIAAGGASWTYRTGAAVRGQPTVAGGVVYAGSDDHDVYAIHAGSGRLIWQHRTGGAVRSAPRVGQASFDTHVYAGSDDGYLYKLGTGTGEMAWRFAAGGAVDSGFAEDTEAGLYVGSDDGALFSVDALDGTQSWRFPTGAAVRATPLTAGDTVYLGSDDTHVYAVATTTGESIWSFPTSGPVRSGLAMNGTVLYAGSDDGYLYAIDTTTARLLWRFRTGGQVRSQILVTGGLVCFGSLDHRVYALHA